MHSSSTQVPFLIMAFIVIAIHGFTSEPNFDNEVKATTDAKTSAKVAILKKGA